MPDDKRCGTCGLWDREKAKDAAGRVRKDRMAKCLWPMPVLPESMPSWQRAQLVPGWMACDYGKNCPCWKPVEAK
jgi:hypothetical protein